MRIHGKEDRTRGFGTEKFSLGSDLKPAHILEELRDALHGTKRELGRHWRATMVVGAVIAQLLNPKESQAKIAARPVPLSKPPAGAPELGMGDLGVTVQRDASGNIVDVILDQTKLSRASSQIIDGLNFPRDGYSSIRGKGFGLDWPGSLLLDSSKNWFERILHLVDFKWHTNKATKVEGSISEGQRYARKFDGDVSAGVPLSANSALELAQFIDSEVQSKLPQDKHGKPTPRSAITISLGRFTGSASPEALGSGNDEIDHLDPSNQKLAKVRMLSFAKRVSAELQKLGYKVNLDQSDGQSTEVQFTPSELANLNALAQKYNYQGATDIERRFNMVRAYNLDRESVPDEVRKALDQSLASKRGAGCHFSAEIVGQNNHRFPLTWLLLALPFLRRRREDDPTPKPNPKPEPDGGPDHPPAADDDTRFQPPPNYTPPVPPPQAPVVPDPVVPPAPIVNEPEPVAFEPVLFEDPGSEEERMREEQTVLDDIQPCWAVYLPLVQEALFPNPDISTAQRRAEIKDKVLDEWNRIDRERSGNPDIDHHQSEYQQGWASTHAKVIDHLAEVARVKLMRGQGHEADHGADLAELAALMLTRRNEREGTGVAQEIDFEDLLRNIREGAEAVSDHGLEEGAQALSLLGPDEDGIHDIPASAEVRANDEVAEIQKGIEEMTAEELRELLLSDRRHFVEQRAEDLAEMYEMQQAHEAQTARMVETVASLQRQLDDLLVELRGEVPVEILPAPTVVEAQDGANAGAVETSQTSETENLVQAALPASNALQEMFSGVSLPDSDSHQWAGMVSDIERSMRNNPDPGFSYEGMASEEDPSDPEAELRLARRYIGQWTTIDGAYADLRGAPVAERNAIYDYSKNPQKLEAALAHARYFLARAALDRPEGPVDEVSF